MSSYIQIVSEYRLETLHVALDPLRMIISKQFRLTKG